MKLYIYDHCPYCVKARMIFGYKNIDFDLITLLNDDEKTPINLIGKKMLPILTVNKDTPLPESLDIIKKIDNLNSEPFLSKDNTDPDLEKWLNDARNFLYPLAMPRWTKVGLEEFKTQGAINYFTKKKEDYIGPFKEHLEQTLKYVEAANTHLEKLETLMSMSGDFYSGKEASINDIHLYPTLRSLSVAKDITFPSRVLTYMKKQEELTKVPLHIDLAI